MKEYLKNELKHLPMIIIVSIIFCGINTLANNHLFNSKDVDYDNSNTHIESTNVGDAIDELFDAANNFTTYDTRLQGIETKVGTGTLNTTAQNLIGGVNELNSNIAAVNSTISKNKVGTAHTLSSADYIVPSDGYVYCDARNSSSVGVVIRDSNNNLFGNIGYGTVATCFVRKGMLVYAAGSPTTAKFIPLA